MSKHGNVLQNESLRQLYFSEKDMKILKMHMKRCSTALAIMEIQTKPQ
jgi:hypothetical protein